MVNSVEAADGKADARIGREVYFFGTCIVDGVRPEGGLAAMKLLRSLGVKARFPGRQTCCGQPAYNSGYAEDARKVAEAQLDLFPDDIPIVLPSASCAEMFREHYPLLFAKTRHEEKAERIAARTFEWGEFVNRRLKPDWKDGEPPVKAYCHVSCHGREQRSDSLDLLSKLENVQIVEIPHAEECCGFGGYFSIRHDGISGRMAENKAGEILASGAEVLISSEASCMLNIQGVLEKKGSRMPCYHLAEFILERIGER